MRNLYCNVEALRKQVFAAVAKLAYEGGDYCSRMEKLPTAWRLAPSPKSTTIHR